MIGRRGFFQLVGACLIGLSIALRPEVVTATASFAPTEPDQPQEVSELQRWMLSSDGGDTWQDIPEGHPLKDGDIVKWPNSRGGWSQSTPVKRNG